MTLTTRITSIQNKVTPKINNFMNSHEDKLTAVLDAAILQLGETQNILEDLAAQHRAERAGAKMVQDYRDIPGVVELIRTPALPYIIADLKDGDPEHDARIESLDSIKLDEKRRGHLLTSSTTGFSLFTNIYWRGDDQ